MELKELMKKTISLLDIKDVSEMPEKLFDVVKNNNEKIYNDFQELVECNLSVDWLQMIFQYYLADRKEKMQD